MGRGHLPPERFRRRALGGRRSPDARRGAGHRTGLMAILLALAVGLVLADSSVVTLALPEILREFDASVGAVAWVLIAFNVALAAAAVPAVRLVRAPARAY